MSGVYVHFPYCRHHCAYCDFNVVMPRRIPQAAYTDAVLAELALRRPGLGGPARTLYIGGGTPSLWASEQLARLVEAVRRSPGLTDDAEVTVEANPAEVDARWLADVTALGVNRVSLGVQALDDSLLAAADRRHDGTTARRAIDRLAGAGLRSWSVDLMFGIAGQDLAAWVRDVATLARSGAPHASLYALTVEPRTRLAWQVRRGDVVLPGDGAQAEMMFAARSVLRAAGYHHYEVSSYARPGHRSMHNGAYWTMAPYLGLGAGAHGFLPPARWWNLRRPSRYIRAALAGDPTGAAEQLDDGTLAFERLMTGLRDLQHGVALRPEDRPRFGPALEQAVEAGRLRWVDGAPPRVVLTDLGLRYMDDLLLWLLPDV